MMLPGIRLATKGDPLWREQRQGLVGASEAAIVLGWSDRMSRLELFALKTGLVDDELRSATYMAMGQALEAFTCTQLVRDTAWLDSEYQELTRIHELNTLFRSQTRAHVGATPDFLVRNPKSGLFLLVETKATTGWAGDFVEQIPKHIWVQLQQQMYVLEQQRIVLCTFLGNRLAIAWQVVERDDQFIDGALLPSLDEFWYAVQNQEPPPADGSASAERALQRLYPEPRPGTQVELQSTKWIELDSLLCETKARVTEDKKQIKDLENQMREAIGADESAKLCDGTVYSLKPQSRQGYEVQTCTYRVLRRHKKG